MTGSVRAHAPAPRPWQWLRHSLEARILLALFLVSVVPLLLVGLSAAYRARDYVAQESGRELAGLARGLAGQVDVLVADALDDARALASLPAISGMDAALAQSTLDALGRQSGRFSAVALLSPSGDLVAAFPTATDLPSQDESLSEMLREQRQVWRIGYAGPSAQGTLWVHTPVLPSGAGERPASGVLVSAMPFSSLSSLIAAASPGAQGRASLLDNRGRLLLPLPPDSPAGTSASSDFSLVPLGKGEAGTVVQGDETHGRFLGYAAVASTGWSVVVERPSAEVLRPAERLMDLALAGIAGAALLASAAAIAFARTLSRPVAGLAVAVRALGHGDASAPLPSMRQDVREVGTLVEAFASMREDVIARERALKESEERYRLLVEHAPRAVAIVRDAIITYANPACAQLLGATRREELVGRPLVDFIRGSSLHGEKGPDWLRRMRLPQKTEEQSMVRLDGQLIDVEIVTIPFTLEGEVAVQVLMRDLTRQKRAEEERQAATASRLRELQLMLEISQSLLHAHDLQGFLDESLGRCMTIGPYDLGVICLLGEPGEPARAVAHRGYRDLSNLPRSEPREGGAESPIDRVLHSDMTVLEDLADPLRQRSYRREGVRSLVIVPLRTPQEGLGIMALGTRTSRQFSDAERRLLGTIGHQIGVAVVKARLHQQTEEAYAELKRREEARARMVAILEATTDLVAITGVDGGLQYLNLAGRRLLGLGETQPLDGLRIETYMPEGQSRSFTTEAIPTAARQGVWTGQGAYVTSNGEEIPVLSVVLAHKGSDERVEFFSTIARDLREHEHAQEALRESEQRLEQAQKMEAVGVLAGGIAHDFNNLLTVINGFGELLLRQVPESDPHRSFIEEMMKAGERAAGLTSQLLLFSHKQVVEPKVLDMNRVVLDMNKLLRRLIGEDIEMQTALAADLARVHADPGQLAQVIMNLATNARDAMPTGGRLTIETANIYLDENHARQYGLSEPGAYAVLTMSDTGYGMDAETRARAWEPFFTTKEPGKGTGLGLSTVYSIVTRAGGQVWLFSEPGHGTLIRVYLPVYQGTELPDAISEPARTGPGGVETVLLVEDEPGVRQLASAVLESSGYRVLSASDPLEALQICEKHPAPIDLLLTDLVMPGMSGKDLAEVLAVHRPSTKVLYMSGYTPDVALRHGVIAGTVPYLQKPFAPALLARKVRDVLDD